LPLYTDREKLRLILNNILDNAVSHADTGGSIEIEATIRDRQLEVLVANSGSQVPPGDVEKTLNRFWRGDASRRATGIHCGLGLYLCRQLVELLQGSMSLESELGGSFRVRLKFPT
jgi:signal transduction histidine kinase